MTRQNTQRQLRLNLQAMAESEFLNREVSWLEFNRRVLSEALDRRTPLLERVAYLAIFTSNLDEFFQKRIGGLKRQFEAGVIKRSADGLTPQEQLTEIHQRVLPLLQDQADSYLKVIKPALHENGIDLLAWHELTPREQELAREYFRKNLFPVLTPLAVDPGHPFPFISNLSTSLGVMLRTPGLSRQTESDDQANGLGPLRLIGVASDDDAREGGTHQFARVKVPQMLPQWVRLCDEATKGKYRFVSLEQIIQHNLDDLFEGMDMLEVRPFRITRNADIERDEEDADDLLEMIEQELRDRRVADVIRMEVADELQQPMNQLLIQELDLEPSDVYQMLGELDYTSLWTIRSLDLPELKFDPWTPIVPPRFADDEADIFNIIRSGDVLVHHPYESFGASVERFLRAATRDPKVIAIKMVLYRTSEDSPFIPEAIRAAESGKQVVCVVELKARFDEERNVQIAQQLEKAGVHVVYGIVGFKTHTKTVLVVRHESEGMRCYAHIGTGNYNSKTAQLYTDLGLFTCDPRITNDLVELFHFMTGRSIKRDFHHLLIAPTNMRRRFVEMIGREIEHAHRWDQADGDPDRRPTIIAKMNSLEDPDICRKLYEASSAGVKIKLIVRGFCCLRPGVMGLSENISVVSIIGRFLEHSRIYYFQNAGHGEYYIGSADWMFRNLNNRVECITPILDKGLQKRLKQILDVMIEDQRQAWDMLPDGQYVQRQPNLSQPDTEIGTHERLMELARRELGLSES